MQTNFNISHINSTSVPIHIVVNDGREIPIEFNQPLVWNLTSFEKDILTLRINFTNVF